MRAFHFRLATLERLRRQIREHCQLDVAEAETAERRLFAEQSLVGQRLAELHAGMRSSGSPGHIDPQQLTAAGEFGNRLQAQLAQLNQKRAQLEDEIARRRDALVEADRELKTLEKLRERQHQQHELAARRADQKLLDDAAARQVERESHR